MRGTKLAIADLQQPEEREDGSKKISDGGWRRIFDDLRGGGDDNSRPDRLGGGSTGGIPWYLQV